MHGRCDLDIIKPESQQEKGNGSQKPGLENQGFIGKARRGRCHEPVRQEYRDNRGAAMVGIGVQHEVHPVSHGPVNEIHSLVKGFPGCGPHKNQVGQLKTYPCFPGQVEHLFQGDQVMGFAEGNQRVGSGYGGIGFLVDGQNFIFSFDQVCDLFYLLFLGENSRRILESKGDPFIIS